MSKDPEITAYDAQTKRLESLFASAADHIEDSALDLAKIIGSLANRESNQFRTHISSATRRLMEMRNAMPIEQYLEKVSTMF